MSQGRRSSRRVAILQWLVLIVLVTGFIAAACWLLKLNPRSSWRENTRYWSMSAKLKVAVKTIDLTGPQPVFHLTLTNDYKQPMRVSWLSLSSYAQEIDFFDRRGNKWELVGPPYTGGLTDPPTKEKDYIYPVPAEETANIVMPLWHGAASLEQANHWFGPRHPRQLRYECVSGVWVYVLSPNLDGFFQDTRTDANGTVEIIWPASGN